MCINGNDGETSELATYVWRQQQECGIVVALDVAFYFGRAA
jgi:hypothetical protein